MTYEQVKHLKPQEFKRLCGVHKATFEQMVTVMRTAEAKKQPGRPSKLSLEDQLLLRLEYLREYRTTLPDCQILGSERIDCISDNSESRRLLAQIRSFAFTRKKETTTSGT